MAAIKSSLILHDGMSSALRKINNVMSRVITSFETVQKASGRSFDNRGIHEARAAIGKANTALDEMERHYKNVNNQQQQHNNLLRTGTTNAGGLLSKLKGVAATYLGMKGIVDTANLSDTLTSTQARLELIIDDGGSVEALQQKIYASAQSARASYTDTMASVAKLGLVAGDAFSNNDEMIKFTELVNKNFVVGGASSTEQSSAMYQLTQALGSGRLQGDEYRSIIENAPLLAKSIEDYMTNIKGVDGTMKEWARDGLLTADVIKAAVFNSADEVEERFSTMPKTWAQVWTDIKNRAVIALDPVLKKINELANSTKVQQAITGIVNGISMIAGVAAGALDIIVGIYTFITDNWSWIGPIVMGVVTALILFKAATMAISAAQSIAAFVQGLYAVATGRATAAQVGLNTALLACPLTWIIALVIALIVVFVIFTEQIMGAIYWLGALFTNIGLWIANCGIAAWEVIKNIAQWFANLGQSIWAVIQNIGAWFGNLGMGIWSVLGAVCSNIGTAFSNAWITVQIGFWSMVDVIMQGLKSLAEFANATLGWLGVNIDTSGLDFAHDKVEELNTHKGEYKSIEDAWADGFNTFDYQDVGESWTNNPVDWSNVGEGFNTFDTFQGDWGSDAYAAGAAAGAEIKDAISLDNLMAGYSVGDPSAATNDLLYDIADDTSDLADSTDKSSEELAYLRDIAEQEAINRFTTAEVKIDMTGMTNRIDSNMDIDGVVSTLAEGFVEALSTASEGV